jgi:cell division protease FtsH
MEQYERARQIILEHRDALDRLAQELLARETLDSVQIRRVVAGLPLDDDGPAPRTEPDSGKTADKEPVLKPILPPITGSNPATA